MFNQQQGTKQMLPFSLQVTSYLICRSVRIELSMGLDDAYNSMWILSRDMQASMSAEEIECVRDVNRLMESFTTFAQRASWGKLL